MIWVIYNPTTGAIVGSGAGTVSPQDSDLPSGMRIFFGVNANPATHRMNAARDGLEPIPVEE